MTSTESGCIRVTKPQELSPDDIDRLAHDINSIYLDEEGAVWPHDGTYERTNSRELTQFIKLDQLLVFYDYCENRVAGCIRCYQYKDKWFFGMLATLPEYRGQGLAGKLIDEAEKHAVQHGGEEIYIELLNSDEIDLPRKLSIKGWYQQKGYDYVETIPFSDKDWKKAQLLKHECYFEIMKKCL